MIYPSEDKLAEQVESRYTLVVLASKRAKQLREGAPKLIETTSTNSITIALEEIALGKVHYSVPDNDELPVTSYEPELEGVEALTAAQEEAAEMIAEAPVVVDEAARVAELLRVPGEEEEAEEAEEEVDVYELLSTSEDEESVATDDDSEAE